MEQKFKMVPVEPTEEMHDAARDWSASKYGKPIGTDASLGCYAAMLAAAPQPPALGGEPEVIYMLRNTELNLSWRDADKAAFDCAAGLANFERRELIDRASLAPYQAEIERLHSALKFYADREHYHFESGNWDTVSGEPLNILWCGDEPDFIEDGTVARNALAEGAQS